MARSLPIIRNRVSRWIREQAESRKLTELIGIPLIVLTFLGAFVLPEVKAEFDTTAVYYETREREITTVLSDTRFHWPFSSFGISQYFSRWHPGLDLTNPSGTPIHPVAEGTVTTVLSEYVGYGKHVIVTHDDHTTSLYAHMSKIETKIGDKVTKDTVLGLVGATGHATGNHLHMEIYQNGIAVSPMEVLPEIKKETVGRGITKAVEIPKSPTLSL